MKKLLTTALVLAMIMTTLCMTPAVYAADAPTVSAGTTQEMSGNDTVSIAFTNVSGAKWVVCSVKANATGECIFIGEKRGNKAAAEGFSFLLTNSETTLKTNPAYFTVEATVTNADGSVTVLAPYVFQYHPYGELQDIIREMLGKTPLVYTDGTIADGASKIGITLPSYYDSANDSVILANILAVTSPVNYASLYNVPFDYTDGTNIPQVQFETDLKNAIIFATINSQSASAITSLINNAPADVGISESTDEKMWYNNAAANKTAIISKLATKTYVSPADFVNQFKTEAFLNELSTKNTLDVISFLRARNDRYTNYGLASPLTGGTVTHLDFTTYDLKASTPRKGEYAGTYMVGEYSSLTDLENKFAQLLVDLDGITEPTTPTGPTGPTSPSATPTVNVGLTTPLVGENAAPFTDIDDVEWAKEAIVALAKEGVIEGVSAKQFQPNADVTREQFVKIIVNTFGLKSTGVVAPLEDVDQNEWYASYINTAVELGIVKGVSDTEFGVGQKITRQDMTVIMYRVANYIGKNIVAKSNRSFTDAAYIDDYAKEAVTALYKAEIVNGVADGVFGGWQTATRAQAAKLCYDLREAN